MKSGVMADQERGADALLDFAQLVQQGRARGQVKVSVEQNALGFDESEKRLERGAGPRCRRREDDVRPSAALRDITRHGFGIAPPALAERTVVIVQVSFLPARLGMAQQVECVHVLFSCSLAAWHTQ